MARRLRSTGSCRSRRPWLARAPARRRPTPCGDVLAWRCQKVLRDRDHFVAVARAAGVTSSDMRKETVARPQNRKRPVTRVTNARTGKTALECVALSPAEFYQRAYPASCSAGYMERIADPSRLRLRADERAKRTPSGERCREEGRRMEPRKESATAPKGNKNKGTPFARGEALTRFALLGRSVGIDVRLRRENPKDGDEMTMGMN